MIMNLSDVVRRGIYRYEGKDVIVIARLPGSPNGDDPDGPQSGDAVMVKYLGDDHKFIIDPADLETDECPKCGFDLKADGYPIGHKTDEGNDCL